VYINPLWLYPIVERCVGNLKTVAMNAEEILLHHEEADWVAPGGGGVLAHGHQEGEVGQDTGIGRASYSRALLHQADVFPVQPILSTTRLCRERRSLPRQISRKIRNLVLFTKIH
jgi:hypothetical protein